MSKRTISCDARMESLISAIVEKNRPFATHHGVARAALLLGLEEMAKTARVDDGPKDANARLEVAS